MTDSRAMPPIMLGVFGLDDEQTASSVAHAIEIGYRGIDTASIYGNESAVAEGIRRSGIDRSELFITTKLWNTDHRADLAREACARSLERLGTDYVDLYLIHWPASAAGLYLDAWGALNTLADEGLARAVGVSNFTPTQLDEVVALGARVPAVNQIELHPLHQRLESRAAHETLGIHTQAWSPFARGLVFEEPVIAQLAAQRDLSPGSLVLAWVLSTGASAVPRSKNPSRLAENLAAASLTLDADEVAALAALDAGTLVEPDYYANV